MANHVVRLYAGAVALIVLFATWMVIATHPWRAKPKADRDPRVAALTQREKQLRHKSAVVNKVLKRRWSAYGTAYKRRQLEIAATKARYAQQVAAAQRAYAARAAVLAAAAAGTTSSSAAAAGSVASAGGGRVAVTKSGSEAGSTTVVYGSSSSSRTRLTPSAPAAAGPAPAQPETEVEIVTLPPEVQVVNLPPVTVTQGS